MTKMETALASEREHLTARIETAERERDNARAQRDEARAELDDAKEWVHHATRMANERDEARADRDALAKALRDMVDLHNLDGTWREYGRDNLPETVAMRLEVAHSALETYAGRNE